ncbi:MAG: BtpA/SgcQ family protein [Candidatus Komeilibacteria bacterium]
MLKSIFQQNSHIVIGAVHFPPLLGYPEFPGIKTSLKNSTQDIKNFIAGGAPGVIMENNYDLPHQVNIPAGSLACLTYLAVKLRQSFPRLPLGISVLWNDYRAALSIAKIADLSFIRIPVFVDTVKTACGIIKGQPDDVIRYRRQIKAEGVQIFTDIHVKHAKLLSRYSLAQSARLAIKKGSDALIITGSWTGDAPQTTDLAIARGAAGQHPILAGSGVNSKNITTILNYANGVIVSTALKKGKVNKKLTNLTGWDQRIDSGKVKKLLSKLDY